MRKKSYYCFSLNDFFPILRRRNLVYSTTEKKKKKKKKKTHHLGCNRKFLLEMLFSICIELFLMHMHF